MIPVLDEKDLIGKTILFTTFHFGWERQYFFFDDDTFCMFKSFQEQITIDEINSQETDPTEFLEKKIITKEQYDSIIVK